MWGTAINLFRRTGADLPLSAPGPGDRCQLVASRILIAKTSVSPGWIPARGWPCG